MRGGSRFKGVIENPRKETVVQTSDIFTSTTKYRKPENQFTASLVYLLSYLWNNGPDDSKGEQRRRLCSFLSKLCGVPFALDQHVVFTIQKPEFEDVVQDERLDNQRSVVLPDFQISSDSVLVWVEVKDTAPLGQDQLKDYRRSLLRKAGERQKRLLLLRNRHFTPEEQEGADRSPWWYELYVALRTMIDSPVFEDGSPSHYLLNQFLKYMQQKGVPTVSKIDREHIKGLPSLMSLLAIVQKEVEAVFEGSRVSSPEFSLDEAEPYVYADYSVNAPNTKSKAYLVQLWVPTTAQADGTEIVLATNDDWIRELEHRKIEVPSANDRFFTDGEYIYLTRPLDSVFEKDTLSEQSSAIGELLREMYDELAESKKPMP